jgi:hypothetical protein
VITAAAPLSSGALSAPVAGSDFFATDAHYQSLAGRIVAALHGGARSILVTGDPPVSPHLLSRALTTAAGQRRAVIDIRCGPKLRGDELPRTVPAVAPLRTSDGERREPEPSVPASSLLVFDDLDRLSDEQIQEIHEAMLLEDRVSAAEVLLAHRGFLARLEGPALRFLKEGLGVQFRLQEVGPDESIAFLRHRLAQTHRRTQAHAFPRGIPRGLLAFGFVVTASIGVFVLVHPIVERVGEPPASAAASSSSTEKAPAPQLATNEATPTVSAQAVPAGEPATITATTLPAFVAPPPAGAREATPPVATPAPIPATTGPHLAPAETATLLARGDKFLGMGDIASARLFYERAADARDASAALRLGATFDPGFLGQAGVRGVLGDPAQALFWYRRARDLGGAGAERWIKSLEMRNLAEPDAQAH